MFKEFIHEPEPDTLVNPLMGLSTSCVVDFVPASGVQNFNGPIKLTTFCGITVKILFWTRHLSCSFRI